MTVGGACTSCPVASSKYHWPSLVQVMRTSRPSAGVTGIVRLLPRLTRALKRATSSLL